MIGKSSINKLNELNQVYLHKLCTNGDKVYVFRFLRFGASLLLISKRSGPVFIVTWWFDEPSITRNGQSRPFGRNTLIEIDLIRLETVFVAMLCLRWIASSIFFKDVVKVGFKGWVDGLNEICWCASFVCWPKLFQVLH